MKDAAWLAWIEQVAVTPASQDRGNHLPRPLFHCRLDDQPDHLVPARLLRPENWEGSFDRPLFINSDCIFPTAAELAAADPTISFATPAEIIWIRDPGSKALQPFWLGSEFRSLLAGAQPGDCAPALSPQTLQTLMMANVLVYDDYASHRRQQWDEIVSVISPQFRSRGYATVGRLIHPFHISALRRYYRHQLHWKTSSGRYAEPPPIHCLQRSCRPILSSTANRGRKRSRRRASKAVVRLSGVVPAGSNFTETHRPGRAVRIQRGPVPRLRARAGLQRRRGRFISTRNQPRLRSFKPSAMPCSIVAANSRTPAIDCRMDIHRHRSSFTMCGRISRAALISRITPSAGPLLGWKTAADVLTFAVSNAKAVSCQQGDC